MRNPGRREGKPRPWESRPMNRFVTSLLRRLSPWIGAGALLQAGSCDLDANQLAAELTTSIANVLITNLVFDAFNLNGSF